MQKKDFNRCCKQPESIGPLTDWESDSQRSASKNDQIQLAVIEPTSLTTHDNDLNLDNDDQYKNTFWMIKHN